MTVGVYVNRAGEVVMIVRPHFDAPGARVTEADFAAHDRPGLVRANVEKAEYEAMPPPINMDGRAVYYDLSKAISPRVATVDPVAAAALDAKVAEVDAWRIERERPRPEGQR